MTYTMTVGAALGSSQTGLTLSAQLKDTTGSNVGSAVTTGFVELGVGNYTWTYASFPDGFRGSVVFSASAVVKGAAAINPEEAEYVGTRLPSALVSGRMDASVGAMAASVLTATAIAADAITDAKVASDVTIASVTGAVGSVTGAVGSVTGNVGGNVTGSVGSVASGGIAAASFAAGAIDNAAIAADAIGSSELAASAASEIATAVRTELATELARLDAAITTRASQTSADTIAGYIDTEVSTLVTNVAAILAAVDTEVAAIKAKTDNLPTDPADASDIAASFTSIASTLATIAAYIDTEVAAIKAKTDNLPASPAATGDIPTAAANADAVWDEAQSGHVSAGTFGLYLDSEVSGAGSGSAPTAAEIAGQVWNEAISGHLTAGSTGAKLNAAGGAGGSGSVTYTYTVYEPDGTTPLDGCEVYVTTDAVGLNAVAGTLTTDAFGEVEFQLDPGTYYIWRKKAGFNFSNPDTEVVS